MDTDTLEVPAGPCPCEGAPHPDGDVVHIRKRLGLADGTTLQRLIVDANANRDDNAELTGKLAEAYLRVGIAAWSFLDERGRPLPVNPENMKRLLLDDFERAAPISDACDDLYMGPVLAPLVRKAAASSRATSTRSSTSANGAGGQKRPKRSKPSSTSTSPTVATETTSS